MNLNNEQTSASRYSGKVLQATIMLVFVFIAFAVFMGYGVRVVAVSKCDQAEAQLAALNSPKVIVDKPKVGVVSAIVHNPPDSSAVVDETIVHAGDKIHDVTVVGIHSDKVEFAKDGVTWQQAVQEAPHAAWTNAPTDSKCPSK